MAVLKKKAKKEEPPKQDVPELPGFFMELALEANVVSKVVATEDEQLTRLNSLTFVSPEMTDEQLSQVLEQINQCLNDAGAVRVGFYSREDKGN